MAKSTKNDDDDDKKPAKHKANTSTTEEGEDDVADVTVDELKGAANQGAAAKQKLSPMQKAMDPDRTPLGADEHLPGDFRFRVENTAAGDLGLTIGPRDPYPTGSPPDPKEEFYRINGFYPGEGGVGGIAGARDTRGPNPKDDNRRSNPKG